MLLEGCMEVAGQSALGSDKDFTLDQPNRRMRTRMSGVMKGYLSKVAPYPVRRFLQLTEIIFTYTIRDRMR